MGFSYNPVSSSLDQVRLYLGLTDPNSDAQLQDEEITFLLSENGNDVYQASLQACDILTAKYSRYSSITTGQISISYSNLVQQYETLRYRLANNIMPTVTLTGVSQSEKETLEADEDYINPWPALLDIDERLE